MVDPADDLRRVAMAVMSGGSAHSLSVRTSVAETLQWMAMTNITGSEFGQGIAERARAIGVPLDSPPVAEDVVNGAGARESSAGVWPDHDVRKAPRVPGRP